VRLECLQAVPEVELGMQSDCFVFARMGYFGVGLSSRIDFRIGCTRGHFGSMWH